MKTVLFVSPFFRPSNEAAAARANSLVSALKEARYQVETLCLTPCSKEPSTWFSMGSNRNSAASRLLKETLVGMELFFSLLKSRHDLVVLSLPPFLTIAIGATALILRKRKFVIDVRDLYPQVFAYQRLLSENGLVYRALLKWATVLYQKTAFVSTVTTGLAKSLATDFSLPESRIALVRNGYDETTFPSPSLPPPPPSPFKAIMHGTLGRFQNIEGLLSIASALQDRGSKIQIHVYGSGPKETLFSSAPPNLVFYGEIECEKIPHVLPEFHLGLSLRSKDQLSRDSFPVKCYEYIGAGLPVVSSPVSEAGRLIEQHSLGWQKEEAREVADLLIELERNPEKLARCRLEVQKKRDLFSRQVQGRVFIESLKPHLS